MILYKMEWDVLYEKLHLAVGTPAFNSVVLEEDMYEF